MEVTVTACDICGGIPDGDRVDHVLFYSCGHAICNNCKNRAYRKGLRTDGSCAKCGQGKDAYHR